jgi:nucleoside-diphosphate-sugar epimerase
MLTLFAYRRGIAYGDLIVNSVRTIGVEMQITILGASGGTGGALLHELVRRGHTITAVNRRGSVEASPGVTPLAADMSDAADAKRACAEADVVVLAAQPPYQDWVDRWPPLMRNVMAATAAAGAKLVFTQNLYAYAPATGPLTEASPERATDHKGMLQRELAHTLLAAHERGELRTAIGRFSDHYGPGGFNSGLYKAAIAPALRGLAPRGLYELDQPHTFHYLPDAARGFAELVERPEADGRVWILPAAPPITQRELLGLVNAQIGRRRSVGRVTLRMMRFAGLFDPLLREATSTVVQYDRPWVTDASRFTDAFGPIELTPHDLAVAETVEWFRRRRR